MFFIDLTVTLQDRHSVNKTTTLNSSFNSVKERNRMTCPLNIACDVTVWISFFILFFFLFKHFGLVKFVTETTAY